ncbi:MAG: YonK family protein [Oscillospiraceae bacterium]|nr:YonK family protein [Oscillospiraceae bacterium]
MAKLQKKYSFSKANIALENGRYIITEYDKDNTADYDLTEILGEFLDKDGVVLSIGIDSEPQGL